MCRRHLPNLASATVTDIKRASNFEFMSNASHRDENVADDTFSVEELYDSDDVRLLFLPPDSPYPDGFASTSSSARPALPFDKVIGNRRPSSSFGIFKYLPYELLPEVGIYLDTFDLAALAFVDRECRQFARSYQFDTLVLDYSNSSRQLVEHLVEEGGTKVEKEKRAEGGSLGRCVRRVVISTTYELFRAAHGLYPDDVLLDGKMVARAFRGYTKYMVVLASLFTHCLPNVEVVQWKDPVAMDAALFHAITSSSARSLQLERFQVRRFAPHSSSRYLRSLGGTGTLNTLHLNLLQCQWGFGHKSAMFLCREGHLRITGTRRSDLRRASSIQHICASAWTSSHSSALFQITSARIGMGR